MNRRATSFQLWDCGDPKCGMHIIAFDPNDKVIVEIVASPKQTLDIIQHGQAILYSKVADRD